MRYAARGSSPFAFFSAAALVVIGGLMVAPACGGSGATGGSATGGSGTGDTTGAGGALGCDENECGDATSGCVACAEAKACRDQLNGCNRSQECQKYGQCITKCAEGDGPCLDDCASEAPAGSALYQALLKCVVCDQCPSTCDAASFDCGL